MRNLWELVWPPVRDGNMLEAARERMLNVMAITVAGLGGFAGALNLAANIHTYPLQGLAGVIIPASALTIPLIARNPRLVKPAGAALCVALYLLVTGMIGTIGGMYHPAAIYFVGLPVPAAFLIGYRSGLAVAVLCCATMLGLYFFGGGINNPFAGHITPYFVGWNTIVLVVLTLGIGVVASVFQHQLEGAGHALDRARRRAHAASRAKSDFLAGISHEIRTPMNAILGMAQALENADIPPAQKAQAETLGRSGQLLLRLVNDVLDLSKIEAGKMEIEATRFSLADAAGTVGALYGPAARDKGLSMDIGLSEAAHAPMIGDPVRISQILNNLVSNAIKFTAQGGVSVDIDCHEDPAAQDLEVVIRVSDTGIGIQPDQAARLFQPFTQADAATARTYGGTGLGLTIVRRLCDLMNGDITLHSVPGRGATFTARLHVQAAGTAAAMLPCGCTSPACDTEARARGLRILAADDNRTNRLVLQALLGAAAGELTIVEDGQQALDALAVNTFDLVLLDSQMPVLGGVETARRIRARERADGQPPIPVYAVTANVLPRHVAEYTEAGMTGVIAKPVSREALFEVLARHAGDGPLTAEVAARSA